MRISYKWLSEFVELPPVEELARVLTAVGFEVEAVERTGEGLSGVIAARIVASEKHPDAEKLSVTRVEVGDGQPITVVCGARNYRVGDMVALATLGTELPGGMKIEKATLRGVESFGMLCSGRELGLEPEASGLFILPPEAIPGTPVQKVLDLGDAILELNVTPNRPDALSHVGLAREVAASTGREVKLPPSQLAERGDQAAKAVRVRIEVPEKCHRYAARVVEGVKIGRSPGWLARRLEACGVRSISNVVDASNYALLELGHPLHAFDLDRVAGREIVVRTARQGEKITTLDGKERALDPEDLLIADRDRGSALAGVMGGSDSEISPETTRVLIESAWFAPRGIRRTARRHGISSEASYRFERGADAGMVLAALDRCAALIAELAGGTVRPGVVDVNARPFRPSSLRLRFRRPGELLGLEVSREKVRRVLAGLGFEERGADDEGASYAVPSWRQDVVIEEDLVEEIVRIGGYDAIPETLPELALATPALPGEALATNRARDALEAAGFTEAVNFSFLAPGELESLGGDELAGQAIRLKNPISVELSVMRTSLLPSLLRNLSGCLRQRVEDARFYEIARAYAAAPGPGDEPARERARIAGVLFGRRSPRGWAVGSDPVDFYDAKAAVLALLSALGIGGESFRRPGLAWAHSRFAATVVGPEGACYGGVGELHPRVAAAFELPRGVLAFELDLDALLRDARLSPHHEGVPRFPAVLRDLAVVVEDRVEAMQVLSAVKEEPLVEQATLFDVYTGPPLPSGKKNLALALRYRSMERTLTDGEVDAAHARIVERLRKDPVVRAELRG
ncbi:MAG TPA: phenylalanine--tRNA ligase subunit beta [Anaeromyxobacteraceae bacterium]|nr:phenylalanine--tRNA ligase subunit beta [Anaeromyxobacteraceae bacterium]